MGECKERVREQDGDIGLWDSGASHYEVCMRYAIQMMVTDPWYSLECTCMYVYDVI